VIRKQLADTADWLGRRLIDQVRDLSVRLKPRLALVETRLERRLTKDGFDQARRQSLLKVTPVAAARMLLARQPLTRFFERVETTGRLLARLNVTPEEVSRALTIADEVIASFVPDAEYVWAREQLSFCTILTLNNAYYEVREAEARAFYELFHIEVESSNVDVLLRRFIEVMAENCGAAAGHVYLLSDDRRHWQLKASTARAASRKTLAVLPATAAARRALAKGAAVQKPALILDEGWFKRFSCVWSIPVADGGVMQLGFEADRELLPRELEMLCAAGQRCHAATQKTRLLEDIALREEQLRKLGIRMLQVEENERRRISRELHDDAGQSLVVIRLQMEMIEQSLPPGSEERERLGEARDITEKTILDIRRLISDLSPAVLEQLGLGAAVRQLVKRFSARYPCDVTLDVGYLPQMDPNFQLVIYRLAQECFNNIAQHSQATAVNISVSATDGVLRLYVEDDGIGFHVDESLERKSCFGLAGIRERVAVLGGGVSIRSTPKQGHNRTPRKKSGTVIRIELPIP
jgi:signal transduction histidine kinase